MAAIPPGSMSAPFRLLMRIPVPWVFILSYVFGIGLEYAFPPIIPKTELHGVNLAGVVVFVIGAAIAGWALTIFYSNRTTTVPGRVSAKLVTWGPYRFTRNPMYVGLTLAYLGEAGILKQLWPVVLLPLTILYLNFIVIPVEESRLKEVFPGDYASFCKRVRRWI